MPSTANAQQQLADLRAALEQVACEEIRSSVFCEQARGSADLLAALPPKYGETLFNLLDRLESSASFTDSGCCCSFNYQSLVGNVRQWSNKAAEKLAAPAPDKLSILGVDLWPWRA